MKLPQRLVDALFGAIGGIVASAIGYAMVFGEMRSDIRALKEDVKEVREDLKDAGSNKVLKGDLCLKMFESLVSEMSDFSSTRVDDVKEELEKLDCYDGVQAYAVEADELPPGWEEILER